MKTQHWIYGDMIMHVVWALLPEEAQTRIAAAFISLKWLEGAAVYIIRPQPI